MHQCCQASIFCKGLSLVDQHAACKLHLACRPRSLLQPEADRACCDAGAAGPDLPAQQSKSGKCAHRTTPTPTGHLRISSRCHFPARNGRGWIPGSLDPSSTPLSSAQWCPGLSLLSPPRACRWGSCGMGCGHACACVCRFEKPRGWGALGTSMDVERAFQAGESCLQALCGLEHVTHRSCFVPKGPDTHSLELQSYPRTLSRLMQHGCQCPRVWLLPGLVFTGFVHDSRDTQTCCSDLPAFYLS